MKVLLFFLLYTTVASLALPAPGLLRVPRVYNALVTSNQNLSPSRAFPVIQPVVHTTAVGYVPPFYYTQIAPRYPGPEVGRLPQELLPAEELGSRLKADLTKDGTGGSNVADSGVSVTIGEEKNPNKPHKGGATRKKEGNNQPLSFYPNYHSLYYDPYFYSYNGFNSHLAPSSYLFDYQPQADLAPLPPQGSYSNHHRLLSPQLSSASSFDDSVKSSDAEDKIPDVPPPPLPVPTSSPKKS